MITLDIEGVFTDFTDKSNWVAIIGSRNPSKEEWLATYRLAQICVKQGKIVVSGLADGIDAAAHKGALDAGGITIAVVSTPIKQAIYPAKNRSLAERIKTQGCIIYPYKTTDQEQDTIENVVIKPGKKSQRFSQRLRERDILVAHVCPAIVAVRNEGIIDGGTRWAMNYGLTFNKKTFRYDNNGKFHENPEIEKAKVWWNMELDIDKIEI